MNPLTPQAPRGLRPEPWPLDERPTTPAPPLLLIVFTVCAVIAVVLIAMWDATTPAPVTVVSIPPSVYVVDAPVTVTP